MRMRTEVYRMDEDSKLVKRGTKEVLVVRVYGYSLFSTNPTQGFKVTGTVDGTTLHFARRQADALSWAKNHVKGEK